MKKRYKIVVYAPLSHADQIREALGSAGAGVIGNYTYCTFTTTGTGRYRPEAGANPRVGEVGKLEEVQEERIETVCAPEVLDAVIAAVKAVHPDEEPAFDVYPIEEV